MGSTRNLAALTSIRFLAALRVAMYHYVDWDTSGYWWRGLMGTPASVSYFFVSSGFLLTYTYAARFDRNEIPYRGFWLGRCLRLLPIYYLGLLVALPILFHGSAFSPGKALLTALLLQAWSPHTALYWNFPAWALSNLAFCYLSLPFLLLATRHRSRTWWFVSAAHAWLMSLTLSLSYLHFNPDSLSQVTATSEGFWLFVLKFNPLVHLPEFFIGMMTGRLFGTAGGFSTRQANLTFVISTVAILLTLLLGYHISYPVTHTGLLAPLLAVLIFSIASGGFAERIFRPRWLVSLGQSSFALYMLHAPLWEFVKWGRGQEKPLDHKVKLLALAGIVALSLALYRWAEAPVTHKLRQRFLLLAAISARPNPAE